MTKYAWTASNNSTFLNGRRICKTLLSAVRESRAYVRGECCGEGTTRIYEVENGQSYPIGSDECTIFTKFKWVVNKL